MILRPRSAARYARIAVVATLGGVMTTVLAVSPAVATVFSNPATITVTDALCDGTPGVAVPYPSNIAVAGLSGTVGDVNVTLNGITHAFQGDLEILLVGPTGGAQNLELLSDAGTGSLSNATVTFDDSAASQAPQNVAWGPGTYKPSNYTELTGADAFPAPAPAPSGNTTLAGAFNGIAPNGTWSPVRHRRRLPRRRQHRRRVELDITTVVGCGHLHLGDVVAQPVAHRTVGHLHGHGHLPADPVTTGTVTFTDGATVLAANVAVNGSGQAAFSTSAPDRGQPRRHRHLQRHRLVQHQQRLGEPAGRQQHHGHRYHLLQHGRGRRSATTGRRRRTRRTSSSPGRRAALGKVTVTLKNVTHAFDGDVEALLVGPGRPEPRARLRRRDGRRQQRDRRPSTMPPPARCQRPVAGPRPTRPSRAKPTNYTELVADTFPAPAPAPVGGHHAGDVQRHQPQRHVEPLRHRRRRARRRARSPAAGA